MGIVEVCMINQRAMFVPTGYSGSACDTCVPGHYRLVLDCTQCPQGAYLLLVGYGLAIGTSRAHVVVWGASLPRPLCNCDCNVG